MCIIPYNPILNGMLFKHVLHTCLRAGIIERSKYLQSISSSAASEETTSDKRMQSLGIEKGAHPTDSEG